MSAVFSARVSDMIGASVSLRSWGTSGAATLQITPSSMSIKDPDGTLSADLDRDALRALRSILNAMDLDS